VRGQRHAATRLQLARDALNSLASRRRDLEEIAVAQPMLQKKETAPDIGAVRKIMRRRR